MTPKKTGIRWLDYPEAHDFTAAQEYLTLIMPSDAVRVVGERLGQAQITHRDAKDLLRAAELDPLPEDNEHVAKDALKIADGKRLSPVLAAEIGGKLVILDGYHRVSAAYHEGENTRVPLLLA